MKSAKKIILTMFSFVIIGTLVDAMYKEAAALMGRPATPGSVAGVSRRTSRRVIRRSTIYAASLPAGCSTIVIEGTQLYQCGASYYQAYGNQYVVVYVD